MKVETISGWRYLVVIIGILIIAWLAAVGLLTISCWLYDKVTAPKSRVVSQEVKSRMKYHGIQYAECDWQDRCWFYRNGKRVKL